VAPVAPLQLQRSALRYFRLNRFRVGPFYVVVPFFLVASTHLGSLLAPPHSKGSNRVPVSSVGLCSRKVPATGPRFREAFSAPRRWPCYAFSATTYFVHFRQRPPCTPFFKHLGRFPPCLFPALPPGFVGDSGPKDGELRTTSPLHGRV